MAQEVVQRIHGEREELVAFLADKAQISFIANVDALYTKGLLLAAASHFENAVCATIRSFAAEYDCQAGLVTSFIEKQALSRRFHTLFSWERSNANTFFALFGPSFSEQMQSRLNGDSKLKSAIEAFMEIGRERNRMVHGDFGSFTLNKTATEIFDLFSSALYFVEALSEELERQGSVLDQSCSDEDG